MMTHCIKCDNCKKIGSMRQSENWFVLSLYNRAPTDFVDPFAMPNQHSWDFCSNACLSAWAKNEDTAKWGSDE